MSNIKIDSMNQRMVREVMIVTHKQIITPHYIRIYLTGSIDTITNIATMTIGVNNKILLPTDKTQPLDLNDNNNFTMRTYTHRGVDIEKQHIWIDFVVHDDESPASGWAIHAQVGDQLGVLMKPKNKPLYPAVDNFLLVGDATAIPVLGAILESLPSGNTVQCIIEVYSKEDEQNLQTSANVEMTWLHNPNPVQGSQLADTIKSLTLPSEELSRFAYVAGEFSSIKAIRHYLIKEKNWSTNELYAFSYWKSGVAEDKSANDRRAEKEEKLD